MNWNEMFRCESLEQIKGQQYVVSRLKALVKNIHDNVDDGDCPHLFFGGPPGVGKTAVAVAFLKDAFGKDWSINFKEFNASETKIDDIRREVIDLSEKSPLGYYEMNDGQMGVIPFNTIFFDEIDYLPPKSQAILRRIIEKSAMNTRFILSCNQSNRVIDALKSRCMCFTFQRLKPVAIKEILNPIIENRGIHITEQAIDLISELCNGDARTAQNILQKGSLGGRIDTQAIQQATNEVLEPFDTSILITAITANNGSNGAYIKEFKDLDTYLEKLYYDKGQSGTQILISIFDTVIEDKEMPVGVKRQILEKIGDCMRDCSFTDNDLYTVKMWLRSVK